MKSIRQMSCGRLRKKCAKKDTENEGTEGGGVAAFEDSYIDKEECQKNREPCLCVCMGIHSIVARKTYLC